jgi:hypothetical protein
MDNLYMDMIKGFGYLLIPGFSALFLLLFYYCNPARLEKVKHSQHTRGNRYQPKANLKPDMI